MRIFWNRAIVRAALVFLLALLVRLYAIERQSLWSDEGGTVALALRSFTQITHGAANDVHPPLYYWALHIWMAFLGTGVFAVRSFSAICGALTVGVTYILGRRWFGEPATIIAAIAAVLSPFAIHYSQETRMYALVTLFGALAWLALDGWLARSRWPQLALFWLAALAALLTHYFAVALIAAANLIWLLRLIAGVRRRGSEAQSPRALLWRTAAWCGAQALLVALYLPLVARNRMTLASWPTIARGAFGPIYVASDALRVFSRGVSVAPGWSAWLIGFLALLAAGLLGRPRRPRLPDGRVLAAAWVFVPLGLMLALAFNQPLYQPRFLLLALPGFLLLIGHGAAVLGHWLRAARLGAPAAAIFLILAAREPLANEWFNPAFWRDDFRAVARDIAATAGNDDAIMLMGQAEIETFDYYYKGSQPRFLLPRSRPLDREATIHDLERIAQRYRRLYALFYVPYEADPDGVIAAWLQDHTFISSNHWYGGVELVIYEFGSLRGALKPMDIHLGSRAWLKRSAVEPTAVSPTDAVRVVLEWDTDATPEHPLSVFAHLLDGNGRIITQCDLPLVPVTAAEWAAEARRRRRLALLVPSDTLPGRYRLALGVYDPTSGERLHLPSGADFLTLTDIIVVDTHMPAFRPNA